ncbi:hypothetical protein VN97_g2652 [Penicillium thymicola]|uniref:Uncharacterized protein n=1 Tax=Penicillium thymicola TaxID=293382 RepID=A0AAI9TP48_PENTH|nr:hypothetical protein VN97_g2652 [Penicillium thymicola]
MISHFHRESKRLGASLGVQLQLQDKTRFMQFNVDRTMGNMKSPNKCPILCIFSYPALPPGLPCGENGLMEFISHFPSLPK